MFYSQYQEHMDHEFGAQYDDVRERYHAERLDIEAYEQAEEDYYEYMSKVYQAGFGDDSEAYEDYFKQLDKDYQEFKLIEKSS
tara:strand:+ start:337 stop:585 length:249 start_codon:yes stop_codon:yes gene_type:complete